MYCLRSWMLDRADALRRAGSAGLDAADLTILARWVLAALVLGGLARWATARGRRSWARFRPGAVPDGPGPLLEEPGVEK